MGTAGFESRSLQANGQRIHVTIAGSSGPLVLLCHGFPESWHSWRHQMPALAAAGYRAVALDMRGYGRSSKPIEPEAYKFTQLVEDCVGVVRAFGESSAVIVGHDIGAPVAWTAAWTRPEVFHAVVGLSLPFGGRGPACLPGSPFGEVRPSLAERNIAGPDQLFYQEYFRSPDRRAQRAADKDLRGWLANAFYSLSADLPLPPELAALDLMRLPDEVLMQFTRATMCIPASGTFDDMLATAPGALPAWLTEADLDYCVTELEYSGLHGPFNHYQNQDLVWEELGEYGDKPLDVPALFMGGARDTATIWSQRTIERAQERCTDLRGAIILPDCGHWIQQEKPHEVNEALLAFLGSL
ncbi:alpha/beta hydrolase (plasmid) [Agrobacterium leguminum]|uniref:alpha/beta fold hydrolase n=1 Tax=Agrobacterium leguminum TaxID=2792015 RepID=UPI0030D335F5